MFFKNYLNGLAETLDVKYRSHLRKGINSADVGELCELFVKEFLQNCLDEHYKIFRGGNIVNNVGDKSPQLDIVLTNKNSLKIFGDKGIYPIETVCSVFSITSKLTISKLKKCIQEIGKIPKHNYAFIMESFYGDNFKQATHEVWKTLIPFTCIFGFTGTLNKTWLSKLKLSLSNVSDHSLWPSVIVVNKSGMLVKEIKKYKDGKIAMRYKFTSLKLNENIGECFCEILFQLFNLSGEQNYMRPNYTNYFSKDYDAPI